MIYKSDLNNPFNNFRNMDSN